MGETAVKKTEKSDCCCVYSSPDSLLRATQVCVPAHGSFPILPSLLFSSFNPDSFFF